MTSFDQHDAPSEYGYQQQRCPWGNDRSDSLSHSLRKCVDTWAHTLTERKHLFRAQLLKSPLRLEADSFMGLLFDTVSYIFLCFGFLLSTTELSRGLNKTVCATV